MLGNGEKVGSGKFMRDAANFSQRGVNIACVQGSTNGANGIPVSFKVLPMVPLVIPLVPMVMPMVPLALPMQGRTQRCCCRGALKAEVLNRAGSMSGGMNPFSLGGSGGPPPIFFSKSMYPRTHFKPF